MNKELVVSNYDESSAISIETNCIICNSSIKLKNPFQYLNARQSDEYICEDCRNVILALKQVGIRKILELSKGKSE